MRIFAVSDLHVDFIENARWVANISHRDFTDDLLILAGDVSESLRGLALTFSIVARRFRNVLYVPGNHDLWLTDGVDSGTSVEKFSRICDIANQHGIRMSRYDIGSVSIVPLFGWYDYTFGSPSQELRSQWMDFRHCRWPDQVEAPAVTDAFLRVNDLALPLERSLVISFSHFVPRIDLMPAEVPAKYQRLYPVLGTRKLWLQVQQLGSNIHVYGHSHVNRAVHLEGTTFVNNAFGYPNETRIAKKELRCVYDDTALGVGSIDACGTELS